MAATDRDSGPTRHASDPAEAVVPGPIARVDRPPAAARDWYDRLSRWYDLVADPFEAPARAAGLGLLAPVAGERILDVGCGTGSALVRIARDVAPDGTAIGLDVADGMCHASKRALEGAGCDSGTVIAGDATLTPFRNGAFDAVFASFVLELFDTPSIPAVLAEWRRILAADGRLCVVALSRRSPGLATRTYETLHDRLPRYLDCRPIYLRDTLVESGFEVRAEREAAVWRLPVEIVHCEPA